MIAIHAALQASALIHPASRTVKFGFDVNRLTSFDVNRLTSSRRGAGGGRKRAGEGARMAPQHAPCQAAIAAYQRGGWRVYPGPPARPARLRPVPRGGVMLTG